MCDDMAGWLELDHGCADLWCS